MLVALRKESVDRNLSMGLDGRFKLWSLSARRAWIEIGSSLSMLFSAVVALRKESVDRNGCFCVWLWRKTVALRKESVDRNYIIKITGTAPRRSLSARRAWIEIPALLGNSQNDGRRSPQGERG